MAPHGVPEIPLFEDLWGPTLPFLNTGDKPFPGGPHVVGGPIC